MSKRLARRVLLIGWDAADWKAINPLLDQGLAQAREVGDRWLVGWSLVWLAYLIWRQRDPSRAATLLEESVSLSREMGDTRGLADALFVLGGLRTTQHEYERARFGIARQQRT